MFLKEDSYLSEMNSTPLLQSTDKGLYCPVGDFYIDPHRSVDRAIITHAHSDHARTGSKSYLCAAPGLAVLRLRLGSQAVIHSLSYSESITIQGVKVSFHPAGHILGSAQVRVEYKGEVWVVSGDYKREYDSTCDAFEPLRCHTFITESTFGLPIYNWTPFGIVAKQINEWWAEQHALGKNCIIYGYSLGKAQRILSALDPSIGPVVVHNSIARMNEVYSASGVTLPEVVPLNKATQSPFLLITPPSALPLAEYDSKREVSSAFASGWMALRKARKQNTYDRGFILSDHADWKAILLTIQESKAEHVLVTHGFCKPLVRYLNENGIPAAVLETYLADQQLVSEGQAIDDGYYKE